MEEIEKAGGNAVSIQADAADAKAVQSAVNLIRIVMFTTKAALKHLNDNGRIIMVGSCVGERNLTPGLAAYAATRGAVKLFSQSL